MKILATVVMKELLEFVRDTRSVVITIMLPFVLFPIVFTILGHQSSKEYVIFVRNHAQLYDQLKENGQVDVRDAATRDTEDLLAEGDTVVEWSESGFVINVNNRLKRSIEAGAMMERMLQSSQITTKCLHDETEARSYLFLSFLLPVLFSVIAVNAPSTAAGHLMGGEKERSTLEALWGTLASRTLLISGKFAALWIIGVLASIAYFGGLFLAYSLNTEISPGALTLLTPLKFGQLAILYSTLLILSSSVELLISTLASSSREALLSILPLTVLFLALSFYAQELATIPVAASYVPVVNYSLLVREVVAGTVTLTDMLRVSVLNIVFSTPFLFISFVYSRSEKVLYK